MLHFVYELCSTLAVASVSSGLGGSVSLHPYMGHFGI
jgi:hypothetical protein